MTWKASPIMCPDPNNPGQWIPMDNPLGELPLPSDWTDKEGCVEGDTIAEQITDAVFGPDSFKDAIAQFNKTAATYWVSTPSPDVAGDDNRISGAAAWLSSTMVLYALAIMILAVAIRGGMIAWRGRDEVDGLSSDVIQWVIVAACGAGAVAIAITAGDEYSTWVINMSVEGSSFADRLNALQNNQGIDAAVGLVAQYLLLGLAAIVSFVQVLLMFGRGGALIVLVGSWMFSASVGMLRSGKGFYTTHVGWIVGFVLYKPAAATIYAGGFLLIGTPEGSPDAIVMVLQGTALVLLGIVALPASIKLAQPATAPQASGRGIGSTAGAGVALAVAGAGRR